MAKDQTEVGITGKPVPKPRTAKQQYELEKKRRMQKHLGTNVGGQQYTSGAKYYVPSTGGTNPRARTFKEFVEIAEVIKEETAVADKPATAAEKKRIKMIQTLERLKAAAKAGRAVSDVAREEYEIGEGIGMTVASALGNPPPLSKRMKLKQAIIINKIRSDAEKNKQRKFSGKAASSEN